MKEQIVSILEQVTKLLQKVEDTLKTNGINIPVENIPLKPEEKIKIPKGYIRKANDFRDEYNLLWIIGSEDVAANLAYALQTTDLFNYFINRFDIGLSVGKIFYKLAIINAFSVIEGIIYSFVDNMHEQCKDFEGNICRLNAKCSFYFKRANKYKFSELLDMLRKRQIITFSEDEKELVLSIKNLRDNIHIWDVRENEFQSDLYNLKNYNAVIKILHCFKKDFPKNVRYFLNIKQRECKINRNKN